MRKIIAALLFADLPTLFETVPAVAHKLMLIFGAASVGHTLPKQHFYTKAEALEHVAAADTKKPAEGASGSGAELVGRYPVATQVLAAKGLDPAEARRRTDRRAYSSHLLFSPASPQRVAARGASATRPVQRHGVNRRCVNSRGEHQARPGSGGAGFGGRSVHSSRIFCAMISSTRSSPPFTFSASLRI